MNHTITFHIGVGIQAPIPEGQYNVKNSIIDVQYPLQMNFGRGPMQLPNGLSTVFCVTWPDIKGMDAANLQSKTHQRHLVIYKALDAINELLQAYKLVRMGHIDACGIRTIGKYDTLFYYSLVDGAPTRDLNVGWKANLVSICTTSPHDPFDTTTLAKPHIGTATLPVARRFLRCYELLEHGFYTESFIIAFSILDDLVQTTLHHQLELKGLPEKSDRDSLLRGIKESRLKLYLGPVLKIASGFSLKELWAESEESLDWMNRTRNNIAHAGYKANYDTAAVGIYACIKILHTLHQAKLLVAEFPVEFFRHSKLTASWTLSPPSWVPSGAAAESMDYTS